MGQGHLKQLFNFFQNKQDTDPGSPSYDKQFCAKLLAASSARQATIWELDFNEQLHIKYATNLSKADIKDFTLNLGEGITGAAAFSRKTLTVSNAWEERQHSRRLDMQLNFRTKALIASPIVYKDILYGVINLLNPVSQEGFSDEWVHLLESFATLYAMAMYEAGLRGNDARKNKKTVPQKADKTVIIGASNCVQDILNVAMKAGRSKLPVLICGETGTGKELAARKIHENMFSSSRSFLSINCSALTESLLESELFGHIKGAFSGAVADRQGKFVAASGGSLFLDEIGEMSMTCQAKILRALQENTVVPVGADTEVPYNARIIAATNRDLKKRIAQNKFRKDLYFRLCGLQIFMPRLKDRPADIPLLAQFFIDKAILTKKVDLQGRAKPEISVEAMNKLLSYSWPGNVRQLEQTIVAALAICDSQTININDLPTWLLDEFHDISMENASVLPVRQEGLFDDSEKERFIDALEQTKYIGTGRWNISAASRLLSIPRKTFVYRMKKMQLTKHFEMTS